MVRKWGLQNVQTEPPKMNASACVSRASGMVEIIDRHVAAMGLDREIEDGRLSRDHGIPKSILFSLRYRPPKRIAADLYFALCDAVEDLATRTIKAAEHDIALARASRRIPDPRLVRAACSFLQQAKELIGEEEIAASKAIGENYQPEAAE